MYWKQVSGSQEEVERRQADTLAADVLENRYAANLDFGGIQTDQVFRFPCTFNFACKVEVKDQMVTDMQSDDLAFSQIASLLLPSLLLKMPPPASAGNEQVTRLSSLLKMPPPASAGNEQVTRPSSLFKNASPCICGE